MGEAAAKEPTMEDILSSIRKIIAEEGGDSKGEAQDNAAVEADVMMAEPDPVNTASEILEGAQEQEAMPVASYSGQEEEPLVFMESEEAPEAPEPPQGVESETVVTSSLAQIAAGLSESEAAPAEASYEAEATQAPAGGQVSRSLADIAASAKAMEAENNAGTQTVSREEQSIEPEPESEPVAASELPVEAQPVEPSEPVIEATKIEMAEAVSAPVEPEIATAAASQPAGGHPPEIEEAAFKGALMSPSSDGAVSGSFDRLKRSVMDDLDAKTEAILRPMLREWLDDNLPNLVERLVREEIERVARG